MFVVEDHYEDENIGWPPNAHNGDLGTPLVNRRQDYWTMLSGATGKHYGNHNIWRLMDGCKGEPGWKIRLRWLLIYFFGFDLGNPGWKRHLNTQCVAELAYMKALFEPRRWYDLVPDQTHVVVTAGYGTYSATGKVSENDYATAARTPDGSLVIVYLPTVRSITVDMSKLKGTDDGSVVRTPRTVNSLRLWARHSATATAAASRRLGGTAREMVIGFLCSKASGSGSRQRYL